MRLIETSEEEFNGLYMIEKLNNNIKHDIYNKELHYHHFEVGNDDEYNIYIMSEQLYIEINYIEFMINTIEIDNIYIVILKNKDYDRNCNRVIKLCNSFNIERVKKCS